MSLSLRACLVVASLGVLALGCTGQTKQESAATCDSDADCASGETCRHPVMPSGTPQVVAPNPCFNLINCSGGSSCPSGMVCAPYTPVNALPISGCPSMVCQAPCQEGSCLADQICGDDGLCAFQRCDEAGAPACSDHYRCDPNLAATMTTPPPLSGSDASPPGDPTRELARGCVRKKCDEDGGFTCRDLWSCDPAQAGEEASGCVPQACADTGRCSVDEYYVCEPTSVGKRPAGTDVHGCVLRNCEEGRECSYLVNMTNYASCDPSAADASELGCVIHACEAPADCPTGQTCDAGAAFTDTRGCRSLRCDEAGGAACGVGYSCEPGAELANVYGCLYAPASTGGTGGSAGAGGSGGSGVGGSAAGGSGGVGGAGGSSGSGGSAGVGGGGVGGSGGTSGGGGGGPGAGGSAAGDAGSAAGGATGLCVDAG